MLIAALILSGLASSCSKESTDGNVSPYVRDFSVSLCEDNSLRANLDITFKKECDYSVTYWQEGHRDKSRTTAVRHSSAPSERIPMLFLYPDSKYEYTINIGGISGAHSAEHAFRTGRLPLDFPIFTVNVHSDAGIPGYVFLTDISKAGYLVIVDSDGIPVWYQHMDEPSRVFDLKLEEGRIWLLDGFLNDMNGDFQRLVEKILCIDLQGNILHKWSIRDAEISIPYVHHEVRQMPDGNIAVVTNFTKEYDLTPIGGENPTTVYSDGFTIFNTQGKVIREWDATDEIDILSCDYLDPVRMHGDLMHANSFNWDSEGNYYMTFNNCSQLWKIESRTGKVLYRVGPGGNVSMDKSGFANGLHAAVPLGPDRILCLDNGRSTQQSRALIYRINPEAMSAEVELCVALDRNLSSRDRSNVELIENGTMLMFGMTGSQTVVFTDLNGNVIRTIKKNSMSYRAHYIEKLPL